MDNRAQDFANKIVAALERIIDLLTRVKPHEPANDPNTAKGKQQRPSKETNDKKPAVSWSAKFECPPALIEEYRASNRNSEALQRKSHRVQFAMLLATILTFVTVAEYTCITKKQLDAMRENFIKDQRPYIMVNGVIRRRGRKFLEGEKPAGI